MAETLVATFPISPLISPDKFYNFFKLHLDDLLKVVPDAFKQVQLLEGEEGKVGSVKRYTYFLGVLGEVTTTAKLTALDDAARSITYTVVDGYPLGPYKSFAATYAFTFSEAKCTFTFERASADVPTPVAYVALATAIFTALNVYLLAN